MELRQYFLIVRKWWWLLLLSTLVATLASFIATRTQPDQYSSKTTLMIGRALENPNPTGNEVYLGQQLAQTYAALAKRDVVRQATMDALHMAWLPTYSVNLVPNTQLLEIQVIDTDPQRAQAVAAELANQLFLRSPSSSDKERQDRSAFVTRQLQDLETNIENTKTRIDELQQQMAGMFSARQIADTQTQIQGLEQKLNSYQANYAQLLTFLQGGINTIVVVEAANLPAAPIRGNKNTTILLAAVIGFALALGAALLLEYLDDTMKSPDDIREATGLATLGAITTIDMDETQDTPLVAASLPKSPVAEAYRVLRTNIQFSSLDTPPRTMMLTSSNPSEGKSTTLANLAVVMAQQGQNVVVLDTDLRRPTQHRIFQVPNNVGLTNALLQEKLNLDQYLQPTQVKNLSVLTTGPLPPNPAELLSSTRFTHLLERLKERADVVLLDSPPALAVTDAAILARQVDGVVLVADAGTTRRQWLAAAKDALDKAGVHILGVTLNRLRPQAGGYYYYYYRRYYTYGEGEGKKEQNGRPRLPSLRRRPSRSSASRSKA
ncbi:MAG: polysaccharide biosynthesis tyrosine autokinase [Caldilineales bacterium]